MLVKLHISKTVLLEQEAHGALGNYKTLTNNGNSVKVETTQETQICESVARVLRKLSFHVCQTTHFKNIAARTGGSRGARKAQTTLNT